MCRGRVEHAPERSDDPTPAGKRICERCKHRRQRPRPVPFSPAQLANPDVLRAQIEWQQTWTQRARQEQQLVEARQPFLYEPYSYDWCAYFTPLNPNVLDPVTGEMLTVYTLCRQKNLNADCGPFESTP